MADDEFVFDWTERLGFSKNPFHLETPKKVQKFYVGYKEERKKLNLFILENHPFGTIKGEEGFGKTMMLDWMVSHLDRHKASFQVSHFNASDLRRERDLIEALVKPLLNIYEKTVKKTHKTISLEELGRFIYSKLKSGTHYLILIDDAEKLPKKYISLFKYFFQNNLKVQVVVSGKKGGLKDFRGVHENDFLEIELDGLTEDEMISLAEKRIYNYGRQGMFPFEEEMLKELYKQSGGSPKQFLKLAREKAVKLALDKDYIQEKIEEIDGKKKTIGFGLISVNIEEKEEPEPEDDLFDFEAPDEEEQKKILKEEEKKALEDAEKELVEDAMEAEPDEVREEKEEKKKEKSEAEKNEELLAELAKDFE